MYFMDKYGKSFLNYPCNPYLIWSTELFNAILTLLLSERLKLHRLLAFLSVKGLRNTYGNICYFVGDIFPNTVM